MKHPRLPYAIVFLAVVLYGCEMTENEFKNETIETDVSYSEAARIAFNHECNDECEIPCADNCETAFAYYDDCICGPDAECFTSLDLNNDGKNDFKRWGWTTKIINGKWYELLVNAGAGKCDISKGKEVGTVILDNDIIGGVAGYTVKYRIKDGYYLSEIHFYIGCEKVPMNNGKYTVAPGQYPYNENPMGNNNYEFFVPVDESCPDLWVIAHAVVCKI